MNLSELTVDIDAPPHVFERCFQFQPRWGNISIQDLRSRRVLDLDFQKRPAKNTTKNSLRCIWLPELGAGKCEWWATWVVPMQIPNSRRCAKLTCEVHWRPENIKKINNNDFGAGCCALPGVIYTCFGKTLASKRASLTHYMVASDAGLKCLAWPYQKRLGCPN